MAMTETSTTVEALYGEHYAEVLAYCARRIGRNEAEDVANEVFTIVWRRRDEIQGATARPWLYGIARGVLANRWRSGRRHLQLAGRLSGLAPEADESPEVVVVRREQDQEVLDALRTLSASDQEVLTLSAWEGLSATEIGIALGVKAPAAEQRLHRAKRRLAQTLNQTQGAVR
jgi:RNA polymerase sigma-70 factor (ECF subfamily)